MREAEPLCAENIGLKNIARSRRGGLISPGGGGGRGLIMYSDPNRGIYLFKNVNTSGNEVVKRTFNNN